MNERTTTGLNGAARFASRVRAVWSDPKTGCATELRPDRRKARSGEGPAFMYSYGKNTVADRRMTESEDELVTHVLNGARVRMRAVQGSREGLYSITDPRTLSETWVDGVQIFCR